MGREGVAWGTAPANALEYNMNAGLWYSFITSSPLGTLKYVETKHGTKGATGQRTLDQHATIPGGAHSEGALEIPVTSDIIGLLLRTALGADAVEDTDDGVVLNNGVVDASPETFAVGALTQPTSGKYPYLELILTEDTPGTCNAGTIVVTGTDPEDNTLAETVVTPALTAGQSFTVYTKQHFKTLVSIVVTGMATGTALLDVNGIQYTTHTITCADTSSSLSIEEQGDPGAGSGNSWLYTGMTIGELGLAFSAMEEEGLFVATPNMVGKYPTAQAVSTYRLPVVKPWPSWICSVTKAGGAYSQIQNLNLSIQSGAKPFRAAVGSQSPAGKVDGGRRVLLSGQLYLADSTEYSAWKNNTLGAYVFTFTSPYKVGTATYQSLALTHSELNFLTADPKDNEDMKVIDFTAFAKDHATNDAISCALVNAKNGVY
jgi:hypothetical protein